MAPDLGVVGRFTRLDNTVKHIVIVGAGTVGAELAALAMRKSVHDRVTLIDVLDGLAEGVALDLRHAAAIEHINTSIVGRTVAADANKRFIWKGVEAADVVVVTSGTARRPEDTSRDDLLLRNAAIVRDVAAAAYQHAPNAVVVPITNPVDVICSLFVEAGFPKERVLGMGGVLDSGRLRSFIAEAAGRQASEVKKAMVLGRHGDLMVPALSRIRVGDDRLYRVLSPPQIAEVVRRTIGAGHELVNLLKTRSTQFGPAQAAWTMVDAVLRNGHALMPVMAASDGAYGTVVDEFIGLPVIVGSQGAEEIVSGITLLPDEITALVRASEAVAEQRQRLTAR
jgi:malate dehydrogenase